MILLQKYKRSFELSTDHSMPPVFLYYFLYSYIHKRKKHHEPVGIKTNSSH